VRVRGARKSTLNHEILETAGTRVNEYGSGGPSEQETIDAIHMRLLRSRNRIGAWPDCPFAAASA
jgi:hypothetical protein